MALVLSLFAFIFSWLLMALLLSPAKKINLLDYPDGKRKTHHDPTPLIGGVCIITSFVVMLFVLQILYKIDYSPLLLCLLVLGVVGILDDLKNISFGFRLAIQCFVAIIMFSTADNSILSVGDLYRTGNITTGDWALPITILAVLSGINALNMMDGIDGLATTLTMITLLSLLFFTDLNHPNYFLILILCAAILPVLLANTSCLGVDKRIFLGDTGSTCLGFIIVWLLIDYGSNHTDLHGFKPITAVWLFAIPLMDMTAIAIRRLSKGKSPFFPDRDHLHHFCQRCGFNDKTALILISIAQLCFVSIGILTHIYNTPEYILFFSFLILFGLYYTIMRRAWVIAKLVRKNLTKL